MVLYFSNSNLPKIVLIFNGELEIMIILILARFVFQSHFNTIFLTGILSIKHETIRRT